MCGIVGMLSSAQNGFSQEEMNCFQEMLYADAVRGEDSTGIFAVSNKGNVKWAKAALMPDLFARRPEYKEIMQNAYGRGAALIGHNRKATQGKVNTANAHPFAEGHTILIHNGTLRNHWSLMDHQKRTSKGIDVDSHIITYLFEHDDHRSIIPKIDGAYTFVWYNAKEQKLRIIRNHERPLAWVLNKTTETLFFASEMGMLYWVLGRHDMMPKDKWVSGYFKERQLYEYALVDGGGWDTTYHDLFPAKESKPHVVAKPEPKQPAVSPGAKVVSITHCPVDPPDDHAKIPEKFRPNFRTYESIDVTTIDPYERIMFQITEYDKHSNGLEGHWRFRGEEVNSNAPHSIRGTYVGPEKDLHEAMMSSGGMTCMVGFVRSLVEEKDGSIIITVVHNVKEEDAVLYADNMLIHPDLHAEFMADSSMCNCWHKEKGFQHLSHENLWYVCTICENKKDGIEDAEIVNG